MSLSSRLARLEAKSALRDGPIIKTLIGWIIHGLSFPDKPPKLGRRLAKRLEAALSAPLDPMEAE